MILSDYKWKDVASTQSHGKPPGTEGRTHTHSLSWIVESHADQQRYLEYKTARIPLKQHHPAILLLVINDKDSEMNTMCEYICVCVHTYVCARVRVHVSRD